MNTAERPEYADGIHPALRREDFVIITAAIDRLYTSLCRWMNAQRSGCIIYGRARIGKSNAIDALISLMNREFQSVATLKHSMLTHQVETEKEFYRNILTSFNHARADYGNAGVKFDTIVDFITEEAFRDSCRRIILFIDEAQWISNKEYTYLRGMSNSIVLRHVAPMVMLVGDNDLYKKYKDFKGNNPEITGRFMNEAYQFRGVLSEDEVRVALNCYDITSDHGCIFTRYFFTTAFDHGWRLSSEANNLWTAFCLVNHNEVKEISMSDFVPAVQYVLRKFSNLSVMDPMLARDHWEEAFISVGVGQ
ncbi:hypothetical protein GEOBRER4_n2067 [Citrifermentans bremense]|uniref:ORC1/DEAH AAA+ ATPase domain-containing protein n=1 Tax=Citrifermentans bremense TaxID=60035 RepID=A0A6S6M6L5_9BACT|nr:ATP-binding protein [Citrifermentans bremense]BCG47241.1 hypothetical protein GEOBRER4_n2067 [Citrifermentans bremense]